MMIVSIIHFRHSQGPIMDIGIHSFAGIFPDPATGVIPSAPSPMRSHPRVVRLIPNTLQSRIRKL